MCMTSNRPGHTLPNTRRYAVSFERQMLDKNVIIYPHVSGYFWIRNFSLADSSPTRIRYNQQLFVSALQSENVEYAMKSVIFSSSDVTRSSPVLYSEYSRRCRTQCYGFFTSWTSISGVQLADERRVNLHTCRRPNSIWKPDVRAWKFLNRYRTIFGFKISGYLWTGLDYIKHYHHQAGAPSDVFL